jgi:hypothetical protein
MRRRALLCAAHQRRVPDKKREAKKKGYPDLTVGFAFPSDVVLVSSSGF